MENSGTERLMLRREVADCDQLLPRPELNGGKRLAYIDSRDGFLDEPVRRRYVTLYVCANSIQ